MVTFNDILHFHRKYEHFTNFFKFGSIRNKNVTKGTQILKNQNFKLLYQNPPAKMSLNGNIQRFTSFS